MIFEAIYRVKFNVFVYENPSKNRDLSPLFPFVITPLSYPRYFIINIIKRFPQILTSFLFRFEKNSKIFLIRTIREVSWLSKNDLWVIFQHYTQYGSAFPNLPSFAYPLTPHHCFTCPFLKKKTFCYVD